MNPAHYNYQVRLREYLAARGVEAVWEADNVDVGFTLEGKTFIGEIKTTNYLTPEEAFRTAVGQVLFYSWTAFDERPACIVLFDCPIPASWVALASELSIAVIVEEAKGALRLLNPDTAPDLARVLA